MSVTRDDDWFENAVIYALDVETFQDSDGDGVGDFRGLTDRLDYVESLGADCLWLLPFYDTPNRDNGYDVRDYFAVDDRLGSLDDVREFLAETDRRDIRVIADLVVNHTSDQHPWFQAARQDPESKYRDYYVWADEPPETQNVGSVFPGEVEDDRVWTYDEVADAYYFHRFYPFQPDLDLQNPAVREEIDRIVEYWLDLGVDGFRIDAATLMIQQKRPDGPEIDDPHAVLREIRANAVRADPEVVLLAEADDEPEQLRNYFGGHRLRSPPPAGLDEEGDAVHDDAPVADDQMDLLLNFVLNGHLIGALAEERADLLLTALEKLPDVSDHGHWANFLRNYDELNVGRLSPDARAATFDRFAPDEEMRIYGRGIRRRLAPMLDGDPARLKLAFSLLFSLPGTPLVLYGDEIGMGDDLSLPGRKSVRTPMQWSDEPNAGFSSADEADLVAPVVDDGPFAFPDVNVADQLADDDSMLHFVQSLVRVRKDCHAVGSGRMTLLDVDDPAVFAQRFDHEGQTVAMAHNLAAEPRRVRLALQVDEVERLHVLLGAADVATAGDGISVALPGYGFAWLRVEHGADPDPE